jgi:hypothetical protein
MPETYIVQGYACQPMQELALLAIFNNETTDSRRLLTVRGIDLRPSAPQPSATVPGSESLQRISAMSAGSGDTITPTKHNAGAAAIPSQVKVMANCVVTATSHAPYRRTLCLPLLGIATGNTYLGNGSAMRTKVAGVDGGTLAQWGDGTTDVISLAEGEGLALVESAQCHQFTWGVTLIFTIGSSTYSAMFFANASRGGEACFGIMNNSGSGVTLKINQISLADQGTSEITQQGVSAPVIRFIRVHGVAGGESLTPVALNAGNSAPAAFVAIRSTLQSPIAITAYESGSQSFSDHAFPNGTAAQTSLVRKWGNFGNRLGYVGNLGGPGVAMADGNLIMPAPSAGPSMGVDASDAAHCGIVLRPQEGFAVVAGNTSGYCDYYFRARVVHTPPGGLYSRARVVNT